MSFHLLVLGAGLAAGFLNVMAGGGSLLTLPILMFLGLPAAVANGTNRIAILIQNVAAVASFRRRGYSDFRTGFILAAFTLPGAVVGAAVAIRISEGAFRAVLAAVLILAVGAVLRPFARHVQPPAHPERVGIWSALALLGIGFYGGFIQAGIGFLFMAVLYRLLGLDLIRVNMHKVFIVLIYTVPALIVFIGSGKVAWATGFLLAAGNAVGALVGARVSMRGGERAIRMVVAVALVLMAGRLVWAP